MSDKTARGGRISYIDVAKGISMICIILGHLNCHAINRVVFPFHVPVFFLITGYFTDRESGLRDFVKKKARTLLVPYFVTCLAIIVIGTLEGFVMASRWNGSGPGCGLPSMAPATPIRSRSLSRRSARSGSCGRPSGEAVS